jgi:energy-coupling factor transporter ATP-binding protein EcfA2
MFVETINTIGTLSNAYEIGKKSQPFLGKIVRLVRDKKLNIVICGAGGTGKSTLGKLLSGAFGREDILQPYQISHRTEELTLDSKTSSSVFVLPGQERDWGEALKKIANNQVDLLINVVSYGYHSIGPIDYQNLLGYQPGMTPREAIIPHKQGKLAVEIELLRKLTPYLSIASKRKIIMITLVTKQDLWWIDRNEVKSYYEQGNYNQIIQEVQRNLGTVNFSHEYFSAALLTENFGDDQGNILAPVS